MTIIGWFSGFCLAFCGIPQLLKAIKTKKADDLSWGFLFMWGVGELGAAIYITGNLPLFLNYVLNLMIIIILVYVKGRYK